MAIREWLGSADGDVGNTANWSGGAVPTTGDTVRITPRATMYAISDGLADLTGVALAAFIVEPGFTKALATETAYLQITASSFEYAGTGLAYIDLEASNIDAEIFATASPATGRRGLYLKGSNLATVTVAAGAVGIAARSGETSTAAAIRMLGDAASVWAGSGVTLTTWQQRGGSGRLRCAATNVICDGGELTTEETGAITNVYANKGRIVPNSSGTITDLYVNGGTVDFTRSGQARTVTDHVHNSGTIIYDPDVITFTNKRTAEDYPISLTASRL